MHAEVFIVMAIRFMVFDAASIMMHTSLIVSSLSTLYHPNHWEEQALSPPQDRSLPCAWCLGVVVSSTNHTAP